MNKIEKFAAAMSELLYEMRLEDLNNSVLLTDENEQVPMDFIDKIVDDPEHTEEMKRRIRTQIEMILSEHPNYYPKDENDDYRYNVEVYDNAYLVDSYVTYQYESTKTKCLYLCMSCGSDNVQVKAWVRPNQGHQFVDEVEGDEMGWCCDEELHSEIQTAELKKTAKVIGYQVVGEDSSPVEGEMHPDMDASFCIYNLEQARQMLQTDNENGYWRLLTIWEGDVEEPTMMFEGLPR